MQNTERTPLRAISTTELGSLDNPVTAITNLPPKNNWNRLIVLLLLALVVGATAVFVKTSPLPNRSPGDEPDESKKLSNLDKNNMINPEDSSHNSGGIAITAGDDTKLTGQISSSDLNEQATKQNKLRVFPDPVDTKDHMIMRTSKRDAGTPDEKQRVEIELDGSPIMMADFDDVTGELDFEHVEVFGYKSSVLFLMAEAGQEIDGSAICVDCEKDVFSFSRADLEGHFLTTVETRAYTLMSAHATFLRDVLMGLPDKQGKLLEDTSDGCTNGCTLSPDLNFVDCCNAHDICYCMEFETRQECDQNMWSCIYNRAGRTVAATYWATARTAGASYYGNCNACPNVERYTIWGDYDQGVIGENCVFPFKDGGVTYNDCAAHTYKLDWCSTKTDTNDNHIGGYEAYCNQGSACSTCSTKESGCCAEDYKYSGSWYDCNDWAWSFGDGYWCSTLVDENGNYITGWWDKDP